MTDRESAMAKSLLTLVLPIACSGREAILRDLLEPLVARCVRQ
jgi:hypothetical protein